MTVTDIMPDEVIYDYDLATGTVKSLADSDPEYIVKDANKKEIDTEDMTVEDIIKKVLHNLNRG